MPPKKKARTEPKRSGTICCLHPRCTRTFQRMSGLTQHLNAQPDHQPYCVSRDPNHQGTAAEEARDRLLAEEADDDFPPPASETEENSEDDDEGPFYLYSNNDYTGENTTHRDNFQANSDSNPVVMLNISEEAVPPLAGRHDDVDSDDSSVGSEESDESNGPLVHEWEKSAFQNSNGQHYVPHTVAQKMDHELLVLLDSLNAPDDAFAKVLDWSKKSLELGYTFTPQYRTRKALIESYYRKYNLKYLVPKVAPVKLRTRSKLLPQTVDVTHFDFVSQLRSLLEDPILMHPDNLLINQNDFRLPYKNPKKCINEPITGYWYQSTCKVQRKTAEDWIIPIVLYTDETYIDVKSKTNTCLCPMLFVMSKL